MCTVTYIPAANGYILSSNRDESPLRAYNPLVRETIGGQQVLFPKDTKGGSWLLASESKDTLCVLNGAHIKHKHQPPYRESRGIIARQYFEYDKPVDFIRNIDLRGIEPFTMILAGIGCLLQFRWDGSIKYVDIKDPSLPHIWSSSTLYTPEMTSRRARWFFQYLQQKPSPGITGARYIHRNGAVGDPAQDYVMNRNNVVRTISISHVSVDDRRTVFEFENLIDNTYQNEHFYYTVKSINHSTPK